MFTYAALLKSLEFHKAFKKLMLLCDADGNWASASVVSELVSERKRLDHEQSVTYIQTAADASAAQPLPLS